MRTATPRDAQAHGERSNFPFLVAAFRRTSKMRRRLRGPLFRQGVRMFLRLSSATSWTTFRWKFFGFARSFVRHATAWDTPRIFQRRRQSPSPRPRGSEKARPRAGTASCWPARNERPCSTRSSSCAPRGRDGPALTLEAGGDGPPYARPF